MQMPALVALSRLIAQLQRYPAEALAALCHSVREDELDARRATQRSASAVLRVRRAGQHGLKTGWGVACAGKPRVRAHGAGTRMAP